MTLERIGETHEKPKRLRRLIVAVAVIAAIAAVSHWGRTMLEGFIERHFIFFPERAVPYEPSEWGMDFEDVYFNSSGGVKLNAWLINAGDQAPMVLWFHGNAGNIADRIENAKLLFDRGLSLFMVDYRGYGRSGGTPSESGINDDGQAAYDYLLAHGVRSENLVVFGRSLGSTVAIYVASHNACAGVILESAFTNMGDMARRHYPVLPGMGGFKLKFPSINRIGSIEEPILFIHGDEDEIVPYELGRRLFETASAEKKFYTIKGAHHNDTYIVGGKEYFDTFEEFVRDKTSPAQPPERKNE